VARRHPQPEVETVQERYTRLEHRLVLLEWATRLLGYDSNREVLADLRQVDEGFDGQGRSFVTLHLLARGSKLRLSEDELARYDGNIRRHLGAMNARRTEPLRLRYFQHLAALYAEAFLDRCANRREELLGELNECIGRRNAARLPGDPEETAFAPEDLRKIAFWMATGSGKTLILHLNYRQFLHYNRAPLDNVLLITPNEGLTDQHLAELELSGIPCARFEAAGGGWRLRDTVQVIEITKLVEEKRGGGVRVDVSSFEGSNLIFVDEGHKGSGGEAWRGYRERLAATGFTFEYSATFGQALKAAGVDVLTAEYGKAILFDYSYRYFHGDGYGKDFYVLNLAENTDSDRTDDLLLANLLSYYEQCEAFAAGGAALEPYHVERPLWLFVGREVATTSSDVLTVVRFLQRFLSSPAGWAQRRIGALLAGDSGLRRQRETGDAEDVFKERFRLLRDRGHDAERLYRGILERVFHATASGALHLAEVRGSDGEIGLRGGPTAPYFGLIFIGDRTGLRRLIEDPETGVEVPFETDAVGGSLFAGINRPGSPVNLMVGAKKFMEGWNSWRVSNLGLLNIGRSEGSEIIQLFGRGVRLRGLGHGLRRSSALPEPPGGHPQHLRLLETLNIFAVRADYMRDFREYLEREGIAVEETVTLTIKIRRNEDFLRRGLLFPRLPAGCSFDTSRPVALARDERLAVRVDESVRTAVVESRPGGLRVDQGAAGREVRFPQDVLDLLDWQAVLVDLRQFREERGYSNLIITSDRLRAILADPPLFRLFTDRPWGATGEARPRSLADLEQIAASVTAALRRYTDKYYRGCRERFHSEHAQYDVLTPADPVFQDYRVTVPRDDRDLLRQIEALIREGKRLYAADCEELPTLHFDRHLYQPLLRNGKVTSQPPALEPSEVLFVRALREHVRKEAETSLKGIDVFLLRNLSRSKGVGFFEHEGFYPDFILWLVSGEEQRIIFVEPHGIVHARAADMDDRLRLSERLRKLSGDYARKHGRGPRLSLDAFLLAPNADFHELRDHYGADYDEAHLRATHVLPFTETRAAEAVRELLGPSPAAPPQ
jgi:hypothetical protein